MRFAFPRNRGKLSHWQTLAYLSGMHVLHSQRKLFYLLDVTFIALLTPQKCLRNGGYYRTLRSCKSITYFQFARDPF